MNFVRIKKNEDIKTEQDHVTWILTALLFMLKTGDFYEDIADDVKGQFDTSKYSKDKN